MATGAEFRKLEHYFQNNKALTYENKLYFHAIRALI
jgi:predicted NAD-dependent protein-ADP-ribosyltransferase YbiA (DUF1768 family)